ncbi:hypothetical protein MLD38_003815 [Melastoma candidum]|uniref:Uncharacterized protein n=1 Tax=Melastoma candidum TaxID=119954 RepID=A0ACB9SC96_9MYRT|nr:hypothetical protein MLD38_003815 [Melastoma candidum]
MSRTSKRPKTTATAGGKTLRAEEWDENGGHGHEGMALERVHCIGGLEEGTEEVEEAWARGGIRLVEEEREGGLEVHEDGDLGREGGTARSRRVEGECLRASEASEVPEEESIRDSHSSGDSFFGGEMPRLRWAVEFDGKL